MANVTSVKRTPEEVAEEFFKWFKDSGIYITSNGEVFDENLSVKEIRNRWTDFAKKKLIELISENKGVVPPLPEIPSTVDPLEAEGWKKGLQAD